MKRLKNGVVPLQKLLGISTCEFRKLRASLQILAKEAILLEKLKEPASKTTHLTFFETHKPTFFTTKDVLQGKNNVLT